MFIPRMLTISVSKVIQVLAGMSGGFPPRPKAKSGCIVTIALSPTVIVLIASSNPLTTLPKKSQYKCLIINFFTTKKQMTKFSSANFQKILRPSYIILRIQRLEGKQGRS